MQKPTLKNWLKISKVLSLKEKIFFYALIIILAASIAAWGIILYRSKTKAVPAYGGEYIEGIVGQPSHINPVIPSNDADDDLNQIIYSGLLKYGNNGQLENDLAESYDISDDKTTYTFHLKKNVLWHDGEPFNSDDVMFTINLISDSTYKSPVRLNWRGITTNVLDESTVEFKIDKPYAGFLNNLTFGIMPKHIWEGIDPEKFSLTDLNLQPIGTGPYKYSSIQKTSDGKIISYKLVANPNYFEGKPYISKLTFNFYPDSDSAINAFNKKEVMGISNISAQKTGNIKLLQSTFFHKFNIPGYFAVFINQTKSLPLSNDETRQALALATNRQEIIDKVLNGNGDPVYAPILSGMLGYTDEINKFEFDLDKANKLLDDNGWTRGEDGFRAKNNVPLQFTLITTDIPGLAQTVDILKEQWAKAGFKVNIEIHSFFDVSQNYIKPREYDAFLFEQLLGGDSDLTSFWSSTQKKDPGRNFSLFGDSATDKLIDDARAEFDPAKRADLYKQFQQKLDDEISTIFLYRPKYIYPVNKSIQGMDIQDLIFSSERFSNINDWYIKTKRVWK